MSQASPLAVVGGLIGVFAILGILACICPSPGGSYRGGGIRGGGISSLGVASMGGLSGYSGGGGCDGGGGGGGGGCA